MTDQLTDEDRTIGPQEPRGGVEGDNPAKDDAPPTNGHTEDQVVGCVQLAMERWRMQNDPGADHGPTMAEYVVAALRSGGWCFR